MNKVELVEAMAKKTGLSKKDAEGALKAFIETVEFEVKKGRKVQLVGFGTFEPRLRKGRSKARNPRTGEQLSVAPHYVAAFRSGQELKKALWVLPVQDEND